MAKTIIRSLHCQDWIPFVSVILFRNVKAPLQQRLYIFMGTSLWKSMSNTRCRPACMLQLLHRLAPQALFPNLDLYGLVTSGNRPKRQEQFPKAGSAFYPMHCNQPMPGSKLSKLAVSCCFSVVCIKAHRWTYTSIYIGTIEYSNVLKM